MGRSAPAVKLGYRSARRAAIMRAGETELQMCVRHVAEQETRIARQEVLIKRLRERRSPILDDALQLLAEMHGFLDAMRAHVARLSN
jgi:hypothetical protein